MQKLTALLPALLLFGCVTMSPQHMAAQSNFEVCRFTMGGPHSQVAHSEAQRRGLDCSQYYGAINARRQAESAATADFMRVLNPPRPAVAPPVSCRSYRLGNDIQTDCN
jgi:hypothetical protein